MKLWMTAVLIAALIAHRAEAQSTPAALKPEKPEKLALTTTEGIAIDALATKLQANQKERETLQNAVRQVEAEIRQAHPGYHFDEASGAIVKDAPKPAEPEKKK